MSQPTVRPSTVIIAEPHDFYRRELRRALDTELDTTVLGEARNASQTVDLARRTQADVLLIAVEMQNLLATIETVHQVARNMRVILMTMQQDPEDVLEIMKSDIAAQIPKDASLDDFVAMLHAVHRGEAAIAGKLANKVLREFRSPGLR